MLTADASHAIMATGVNAPQRYTITLEPDLIFMSALQLEAIPFDAPIAGNPGPGRYAGKFAISEMAVTIAPKSSPEKAVPVKFVKYVGYSKDRGAIADMFDEDRNTYWAIERRRGVTTNATMLPKHPIGYPGGSIITVELDHKLNLGRFRINATTSREPEEVIPPLQDILSK